MQGIYNYFKTLETRIQNLDFRFGRFTMVNSNCQIRQSAQYLKYLLRIKQILCQ